MHKTLFNKLILTANSIPSSIIKDKYIFSKNMYINSLPRVSTKLKFILCADDTIILHENSDAKTVIKTINTEMPKIIQWLKSNKLRINVNKTVATLFHTRQTSANIDDNSIVIDGNVIAFTTNTKFLSINIDNDLTWKAHINHITTKISKGVGVLLRLCKKLSYNILFLIYNTILLPYLTYCCIIWAFTYQTHITKY